MIEQNLENLDEKSDAWPRKKELHKNCMIDEITLIFFFFKEKLFHQKLMIQFFVIK
jgi:hypothetical protein